MVERVLDDCVWIAAVAVDELIIERVGNDGIKNSGLNEPQSP